MADMLPVAIMAGGYGTRLGELTKDTPKSLVEVAGKPFIRYQLDLLKKNGIARVVVCAGHLGDQVGEELSNPPDGDIQVVISQEGEQPIGTAEALRRALPMLGGAFFVLYGDSYLDCDMPRIQQAWRSSGKLGLMTICDVPEGSRANVEYRFGELKAYDKTQPMPAMRHIDYGLGIMTWAALDAYPEYTDIADVYSDLALIDQLEGFLWLKRYYSIGSPSGLERTRKLLEKYIDS